MQDAHYEPTVTAADPGFVLGLSPWSEVRAMPRPHWHDSLEINYTRCGHGRYVIGGRTLEIRPGTVYVIPPGVPHQSFGGDGDPHWNLTLYFRPTAVVCLGARAADQVYETMGFVEGLPAGGLRDDWERLVAGLYADSERHTAPDAARVAGKLMQACLLVRRSRSAEVAALDAPGSAAGEAYVERTLRYVERRIGRSLSLRDIAAHVGLHPAYLCAVFHDRMGIRLFEYILARRVHQAYGLLLSTDLPIKDVAARTGFADLTTFYRRFREVQGLTPGQARAQRHSLAEGAAPARPR